MSLGCLKQQKWYEPNGIAPLSPALGFRSPFAVLVSIVVADGGAPLGPGLRLRSRFAFSVLVGVVFTRQTCSMSFAMSKSRRMHEPNSRAPFTPALRLAFAVLVGVVVATAMCECVEVDRQPIDRTRWLNPTRPKS